VYDRGFGERLKYETAVPLGRGSMGEVFKAWDPALQRFVALKYLRRDDPALADRLLREARLQARVDHDRVCKVYEAGVEDGRPFIAMQYVDGRNLEEEAASLSVMEAAALMAEVAEAVHAAHETGLIHRDLKPQNVLVERTPGGLRPHVVDFGLAREPGVSGITETGTVVGTPAYMSPEQAAGDVRQLDRRTDVYALGAVLYRLLAGRPPFVGSDLDVTLQVAHAEPPALRRLAPSAPRDLETIVMVCLEKARERRYASARALALDLRRFLAGQPIEARPASWSSRARRRVHRNPALAAVVLAASAWALALGGLALRARQEAEARAQAALHFGQEAERIETVLRQAYLLPAHDLHAERALVREKLASIESEMARGGSITEGPGQYALGRGHLALGELEPAREHLERAWASGYRTPEVGRALGRTVGELYMKAAEAGGTGVAKDAARWPALERLLGSASGTREGARYWNALAAYCEARYDDALAGAREAAAESPAHYEARLLEGHVQLARGDLGAAREAFRQALAVGRSDPRVQQALAAVEAH
jgi:predicted Ser/Thr protein kinase/tetratricopeptide (TPR) repeat protein